MEIDAILDLVIKRLGEWLDDENTVAVLFGVCMVSLVVQYYSLWQRRRRLKEANRWSLTRPLVRWSEQEALTLGNAFEGIFVCGATGSGKTSGSGRTIAESFLCTGAGGLVCTVKPDEVALWQRYCRDMGRLDDLVVFGPGQGFNFLRYESAGAGGGAGLVENIADLLAIGCEIADRAGAQSGGGQEDAFFWKNARQQACRNAITALNIAYGSASVPDLFEFVISAPATLDESHSERWKANSFCFQTFVEAEKKCRSEQEQDLGQSYSYFTRQLPSAGEKTRGNILMTLTSMADVLNRELARQLLCGATTVTPEAMEHGKIVVLNVPIGEYGITGRLIQGIVRYSFQRAMLRRDARRSPRPVFFWADEAQFLVNSYDMHFLSTCRSFRVANVYMTQNLSNMYAALGGLHKGKAEADSILANLNLKIMHANGCPITNEWAAASIGQTRQFYYNANNSYQPNDAIGAILGLGPGPQTSAGVSEHLDYEVAPSEFTRLRTGGPQNDWNVDAIVFQSGRVFADMGRTWRHATFRQKK